MTFTDNMRTLSQHILSCHEARGAGLAALRGDTTAHLEAIQTELRGRSQARQALAHQQRTSLANVKAGLDQAERGRHSAVDTWLSGLAPARTDMAHRQRETLARDHAGLNNAEHERSSRVCAIMADTRAAHKTMAQHQGERLAKGRADLAQSEQGRSSNVHAFMATTATAHQTMARQQRERLAKVRGDLARAQERLSASFRDLMAQLSADHDGARREWQAVWSRSTKKGQGGSPSGGHTNQDLLAGGNASPKDAAATPHSGPVTPQFFAIRNRTFEYLANHPDGSRPSALEEALGTSRLEMARVLRSLAHEGKAEKRGPLYFAI